MKQTHCGPTFLMLVSDGILLFLSLLGVAFSVLSAYSLEVDEPLLLTGIVGLTLLFLFLWYLPRFRMAMLLLATTIWTLAIHKGWEILSYGEVKLRCAINNTMAAKVSFIGYIQPVATLPDPLWAKSLTLWLIGAGFLLALVLGWLICRWRRTVPVIVVTLLPIAPALCVTEAPDPLSLACLLTVWATLLFRSWNSQFDPVGSARMTPYALGASALTLAILMQIMPLEGVTQTGWAAKTRSEILSAVYRMDFSALIGDLIGWRSSGSSQMVSLSGGSPSYTGRTALRVQTDAPGKHYLRGYSADVYTGTRWEPLGQSAQNALETIREQGDEPLLMLDHSMKRWGLLDFYRRYPEFYQTNFSKVYTMRVENVGAPGGCIYYPYILAEQPEGALFGGDSHLERDSQTWEHAISFQTLPTLNQLRQALNPLQTEPALHFALTESEQAYNEFVYEHDLDVPDSVLEGVDRWLRKMGVSKGISALQNREEDAYKDAYEVLERSSLNSEDFWKYWKPFYALVISDMIINMLHATASYDPNTPAPPDGEDYVSWFLNESKTGYCMHFATAAALLFRIAGIPARYVSGYVVDVPEAGYAVVPDRAAHAWVEIYLDGWGWFPIEATPGYQGNEIGESVEADFIPEATETPEPTPTPTPAPVESSTATPNPEPSSTPTATTSETPAKPNAAFWLLLITVCAALPWIVRLLVIRRRQKKLYMPDTNQAVFYALVCCRALQKWGIAVDPLVDSLAQKAKFSPHVLTEPERQQALVHLKQAQMAIWRNLPAWKKPFFWFFWGNPES